MSTTSAFIYMALFTTTFLGLSVLYGSAQPGFQNVITVPENCLFNNVPSQTCSFPAFNPPTPTNVTTLVNQTPWYQCIFSVPCVVGAVTGAVGGSSTAQTIWNGFSEVGYALGLFPVYAYVFFNKCYLVLVMINVLVGVVNTDYGVPFLGYIFFGFTFIFLFLGIAVFKPGGSGG